MGKTSKDKRDIYYRLAKEEGWRARSAYKLLQIDEQYQILSGVGRVVDLCAAPGSWSQVLSRRLSEEAKIVAVDLQLMAPLPRVIQLQGDITREETAQAIRRELGHGLADLVVCDGAPDVTGLHELDEYVQSQLLVAALHLTLQVLRPGGTFLAKIFRGPDAHLLLPQVHCFFGECLLVKPRSSRNSSLEAFILARHYRPPTDLQPQHLQALLHQTGREGAPPYIPFVACGDLNGYDADAHYALASGHLPLPPVQPPLGRP